VERIAVRVRRVRSPIVDGLFYPEDAEGVLSYVHGMGFKRGRGGLARAIVAPHGAWEISGSLAGAAFASAAGRGGEGKLSRVVVMGSIHDAKEAGIFLSHSDSFQTPLGDITVDQEATGWLEAYSPAIRTDDIPHLHEHSIEVLLPFVKYFFPQASIVPILMSGHDKSQVDILSNALQAVFAPIMDETLMAVSFNMEAGPESGDGLGDIEECVRLFREGKLRRLQAVFDGGRVTGCGCAMVNALIRSTLLDGSRPGLVSESLLSARDRKNETVYYGAFSFV